MSSKTHNIELNEKTIKDLLLNKKNLNFTGHDIEEGASSPLTYSIYHDKKELFTELLEAGADINYQVDKVDWSSLTYAIRFKNDFYLRTLLAKDNLNLDLKINGSNPVEHALKSCVSSMHINYSDYKNRIKLIFSRLENDNIDPNIYFNKNGAMWSMFLSLSESATLFINLFPKDWLKKILDKDYFNDNGLYLLKILHIADKSSLKKLISLIDKDQVYKDKNTLLHHYVLNNHTENLYNERSESVIIALLDAGFDCYIKNKRSETVHDALQEEQFYKDYCTTKNYQKLENELNKVEQKTVRKLKL